MTSLQNAPITSWPGSQRQVLVPSWQQLPGLAAASQPPAAVQRHIVAAAAEPLNTQNMPVADSWRRSLMVDPTVEQTAATVIPVVSGLMSLFH